MPHVGKNIIHCFLTGSVIRHFTSKSTVGYLSKILCDNASQNVFVDNVSQYDTQLQLVASLVAIPTCKPTIGNKTQRAMIMELMIPDVTFVTFTDATISKHFICRSMELNLKTRCSSASVRLSKIEFCCTSCLFSSHSASLQCCATCHLPSKYMSHNHA